MCHKILDTIEVKDNTTELLTGPCVADESVEDSEGIC